MEFTGRYSIPAPPEAVWTALHDPAVLAAAIPGCDGLEKLSETSFKAKVLMKIGPLKARFEGKVDLNPIAPPDGATHAMTLTGEGQGGPAGFARGASDVVLAAADGGTVLTYDAKATVGGRLAQVGQRLIDGAAKSLADEFFAKFAALMQPPPPESETPAQAEAGDTEDAANAPREEGLAPQIWVAGLIVIVIILLIVFSIVL
jgi:uncharacterized protein